MDPSTGRLHFLSSAEPRYATIELEILAVVWTVLNCKMFLAGLQSFKNYHGSQCAYPYTEQSLIRSGARGS